VGIHSAVLWGVVMTIFAFLPLVGITVVTLPAALLLYFDGRGGEAFLFFAFCTAQGLIIENVVKTRLMGSAMRMHDLLVFLSILGGISAFGVIGLIYGPLLAMFFITLSDLYFRHYRPHLALRLARSPSRLSVRGNVRVAAPAGTLTSEYTGDAPRGAEAPAVAPDLPPQEEEALPSRDEDSHPRTSRSD